MKKIVLIAAIAASAVFAETAAVEVKDAAVDAASAEATQVVTEAATEANATEATTEAKEATPAM